jgi:hypothetical protein
MKRIKTILFCKAMLLFCFTCNSQLMFQRTFDWGTYDYAESIEQTEDGNYVMCGQTGNGAISVSKLNSTGDTLWARSYGGSGNDFGFDIKETYDSCYIVGGRTNYGGGGQNCFLMKISSEGLLLWTKTYGGPASDCIYSVRQSTDGGFIAVGSTYSFGAGSYDIYLIKTDAFGNLLWSKVYGGSSLDEGKAIELTSDGGYIITGTTVVSSIAYNSYLLKTDFNGNVLWSKAYGGTANGNYGFSVDNTAGNGFAITGYTGSGAGNDDAFLIRTDSAGNLQWSKTYGNTRYERANSVRHTSDGGFVLAGVTNRLSGGNLNYIIRTDSNGDTLWTRCFGGTGLATSIRETNDSGFICYGYVTMFPLSQVGYVVKTDPDGNSNNCHQYPSQTIVNNISFPGSNITFLLSSGATVTSPSLITYYSPAVGDPCSITTGLDPNTSSGIESIYPNPFDSETNILFAAEMKNARLSIFDMLGKEIKTMSFSGKQLILERGAMKNGIYFLKIVAENNTITCRRLVIQ